jgi:hypothetical protein
MKPTCASSVFGIVLLASNLTAAVFSIGGFSFDEKNAVSQGMVAQGDSLSGHSNSRFARFSGDYVEDPNVRTNQFDNFNRSRSIGCLMEMHNRGQCQFARGITLPGASETNPRANTSRYILQFGWDTGQTLENMAGEDFVIFESGKWEGFAVAVQQEGDPKFSAYRYKFANSRDDLHNANAVAFDLSDFGIAEGGKITAIRIENLMNSKALGGPDKVDDVSGQGQLLTAKDPGYGQGFLLRQKADGPEFSVDLLDADIVYVTALHDVKPVKTEAPTTPVQPEPPRSTIYDAAGSARPEKK